MWTLGISRVVENTYPSFLKEIESAKLYVKAPINPPMTWNKGNYNHPSNGI